MTAPTDIDADPFGERGARAARWRASVLGLRVQFESADARLLALARAAFGGLPPQRFPDERRQLRIELRLVPDAARTRPFRQPARLFSGGGLLGGLGAEGNAVLLAPRAGRAVVMVTEASLQFAYQVRYELIEFAVYTLAARVQQLASLHAAAIGRGGRGILLMGPSGAGKSTLSLLSALQGFTFLSEDSAFVQPASLLATGVPNFLHARADTLRWVQPTALRARLRESPVIRRRSGVRKFEIDLRQAPFRVAAGPLRIKAVALLSAEPAAGGRLCERLRVRDAARELRALQGYAADQPAWRLLERRLRDLPLWRVRRGAHPQAAVDALGQLLR